MKRTFSDARSDFVAALEKLRADVQKDTPGGNEPEILHIALDSVPDKSNSETLYTDIAILRARAREDADEKKPSGASEKRNLCFVTSGIHGIEGYAGSALQTLLLGQSALILNILETSDICFIHAANPWGMQNFQRTDQQNIDLNRNCHIDNQRYKQTNPTLSKLRSVTAPKKPVKILHAAHWGRQLRTGVSQYAGWASFYARLLGLFLRTGVQASTLAVVNGQYEYPDDLFYGGKELSSHLRRLQLVLVDNLCRNQEEHAAQRERPPYETCSVIDIHTGLGPKGGLTLLLTSKKPLNTPAWISQLGSLKIQFENRADPVIPGIFAEWLCEFVLPQRPEHHAALVFEIGTFGNGSLASNLESLRRMVEANQLRHFGMAAGDGDRSTARLIHDRFRELFLPTDASWEQMLVTERFKDLQKLLTVLAHQKRDQPILQSKGSFKDDED